MDANEAKDLLLKTKTLHLTQFKEELELAEMADLLSKVLRFKRQKLLESCLADHPVEDLFALLEAVNTLDDERLKALDEKVNNSKPLEVAPDEQRSPTKKRPNRQAVDKPRSD